MGVTKGKCPLGFKYLEGDVTYFECCACLWNGYTLHHKECENNCPHGGAPLPCLSDKCIERWARDRGIDFGRAKRFWKRKYLEKYGKGDQDEEDVY